MTRKTAGQIKEGSKIEEVELKVSMIILIDKLFKGPQNPVQAASRGNKTTNRRWGFKKCLINGTRREGKEVGWGDCSKEWAIILLKII